MKKVISYEISSFSAKIPDTVLQDDGNTFILDDETLNFIELKDLLAALSSSPRVRDLATEIFTAYNMEYIKELRTALSAAIEHRNYSSPSRTPVVVPGGSLYWPEKIPF